MKNFVILLTAMAAAVLLNDIQVQASYVQVVLDDNPIAYYRFREINVTDSVHDETGNHNGSFRNNPTLGMASPIATDPGDTAVHFNRNKSTYAELTRLGDYGTRLFQGFSVEFWLNSSNAGNYQAIMGTNNPGSATAFIVDIANHTAGELRIYFRDEGYSRYEHRFYSLDPLNPGIFDGVWHHIVYAFDPTISLVQDRVSLYIDGQQEAISSTTLGGGTPDSFSNFVYPMTVAAWNNRGTVQAFLGGSLDEAAFYTHPLSMEEVLSHYNAAIPEPGTLILLGLGSLGLLRKRRTK